MQKASKFKGFYRFSSNDIFFTLSRTKAAVEIFWNSYRSHCVNTVSRKCEYGISKTPYSHFRTHSISNGWKIQTSDKKLQMERKWPFNSSIFSYVTVKVNVVTCEYIDLKIVPSSSLYMTNCSTAKSLLFFNNDYWYRIIMLLIKPKIFRFLGYC